MDDGTRKTLLWTAAGLGAFLALRAAVRYNRSISLRGRTALITGGSRGLGLVLARELAREGARLALCARDPDELERARAELAEGGAEVLAVPCDVTDREQVARMVLDVIDRYGRIDVLVNNAGVIEVGPVEVMTLADFEETMRTHFWGPLYTTLNVLPYMRRHGEGRIVNICSIGGKISMPHLLPYNASKYALVGLSEVLRAELLKDGIYVTTVIPGLMRTGSPRNATFKGQHRAEYAWFSIGDSIPFFSIGAERAARQIVAACKGGDAEVILSVPAQVAVRFHGVFPGLTADVLGLVNRLLPGPGGIGTARAKGKESTSAWSPSWLTALTEEAARRNNEFQPHEVPVGETAS
jgi:NAD(P)-dependent dehydrogenase (short-subunit alcohol dehydrogenase family)